MFAQRFLNTSHNIEHAQLTTTRATRRHTPLYIWLMQHPTSRSHSPSVCNHEFLISYSLVVFLIACVAFLPAGVIINDIFLPRKSESSNMFVCDTSRSWSLIYSRAAITRVCYLMLSAVCGFMRSHRGKLSAGCSGASYVRPHTGTLQHTHPSKQCAKYWGRKYCSTTTASTPSTSACARMSRHHNYGSALSVTV